MRPLLVLALLTACGHPPAATDHPSSAELDHQDPGADTSKHSVLHRTAASWHDPEHEGSWLSGLRAMGCVCAADAPSDGNGVIVVLALAGALRRRRNRS